MAITPKIGTKRNKPTGIKTKNRTTPIKLKNNFVMPKPI